MSVRKSQLGSAEQMYPVRPAPSRVKSPWSAVVALAGLSLFFAFGLLLLLYCLSGGEQSAGIDEPVLARLAKPQTQVPPVLPGSPPVSKEVASEELVPKDDATPVAKPRGDGADHPGLRQENFPKQEPPPITPLVELEPKQEPTQEPKPAPKPELPGPPTPRSQDVLPGALPSLLPNEKTIVAGPLELPQDVKHKIVNLSDDGEARRLKLAVTPARYDNMGLLLNKLGEGYKFTSIREEELRDLATLRRYDVLFLTCSEESAGDLRVV